MAEDTIGSSQEPSGEVFLSKEEMEFLRKLLGKTCSNENLTSTQVTRLSERANNIFIVISESLKEMGDKEEISVPLSDPDALFLENLLQSDLAKTLTQSLSEEVLNVSQKVFSKLETMLREPVSTLDFDLTEPVAQTQGDDDLNKGFTIVSPKDFSAAKPEREGGNNDIEKIFPGKGDIMNEPEVKTPKSNKIWFVTAAVAAVVSLVVSGLFLGMTSSDTIERINKVAGEAKIAANSALTEVTGLKKDVEGVKKELTATTAIAKEAKSKAISAEDKADKAIGLASVCGKECCARDNKCVCDKVAAVKPAKPKDKIAAVKPAKPAEPAKPAKVEELARVVIPPVAPVTPVEACCVPTPVAQVLREEDTSKSSKICGIAVMKNGEVVGRLQLDNNPVRPGFIRIAKVSSFGGAHSIVFGAPMPHSTDCNADQAAVYANWAKVLELFKLPNDCVPVIVKS